MNYYRRYVGDYLRDTSRLSMLEHGAYVVLLDYYYAEEAPLPLDVSEIYRLVRAILPEERRAVDKVLLRYFVKRSDGYHNKRADEELAKGANAIEQMADAGRRGAEKRWGRPSSQDAGEDRVPHDGDRVPHAGRNGVDDAGNDRVKDAGGDRSTNHQPPTTSLQPPTTIKTGRKRPCVCMPESFAVSERVKAWAGQKGFGRLEAHLEHFVGWAKASGKVYADWDQALMNAIRDDWAKVRVNGAEVDVDKVVRELEEEERRRATH